MEIMEVFVKYWTVLVKYRLRAFKGLLNVGKYWLNTGK